MFEISLNSKSYKIIAFTLLGLVIIGLTIALVPPWREKVQSFFGPPDRLILAKSQGELEPGGTDIVAVKIKSKDRMLVEIYRIIDDNTTPELLADFTLEGNQDGFYNYQNQSTNLVLTDIDGDGYTDVVAPTFDDRQQPRLNVFKYDAQAGSFAPYQKDQ